MGVDEVHKKKSPTNDTIDDIPGSDDTCVECVVAHKHQIRFPLHNIKKLTVGTNTYWTKQIGRKEQADVIYRVDSVYLCVCVQLFMKYKCSVDTCLFGFGGASWLIVVRSGAAAARRGTSY